ncbi:sporulation transcription factor Spo0A [Marinococcus halophilus]|uniref:Stage 0 sporulation protein A n=1 Tax=Marinococcus halophilus TaxID=1371 RepID=A0A510Y847_MARHA|nr:sporulation transcription factor Spo0A [Marinococcus halophilus]OZT80960.1 sporulation transcription factor Spo0A [Marinococcus halophilus]GEK59343.1 stage 0 sporulation protein A [Marinococcus halophilus]
MIRVAVADDNKELVEVLIEHIEEQEDMEIAGTAHNGEEALEVVEQEQPEVLLLDIIMPHRDGLSVLTALKNKHNINTKIIMLTAFGHEDVTKKAVEYGAAYYVLKPFDMEALMANIRDVHRESLNSQVLTGTIPVKIAAQQSMEERIKDIIQYVGIPSHIKGYVYMQEAVKLVMEDMHMINAVTKQLYPEIARKFQTTPSRVERALRHAIVVAWDRGHTHAISDLFGWSQDSALPYKPSNSEFIAVVSDRLRTEQI